MASSEFIKQAGNKISWRKYQIAKHQLAVTRYALNDEIQLLKDIAEIATDPDAHWRVVEELQLQLQAMREVQNDLDRAIVQKRRWWEPMVLKVYHWSVKDRFEIKT